MDRRRYTPCVDGLETRVVLSAATASAASQAAIVRANASAAAKVDSSQTTANHDTHVAPAVVTTPTPPTTTTTTNPSTTTGTTKNTIKPEMRHTNTGASTQATAAAKGKTPTSNTPPKAQWQQTRIDRLPLLLQQTSRTRVVPPALVQSLQGNLVSLANNLHRPSAAGLQAFNNQLRATISRPTIRLEDSARLNALFGKILTDAGTAPLLVQRFQADMNELSKINSFQNNSANLVANDYGLLLQISLGVGVVRPGAKPS